MEKKVAVVTGANKGLGFALVKGLCEKLDGTVYLTSRDEERGIQARNQLKKISLKPEYCQLDVTEESSIKRFLTYIQNKREKIEILINNAGVLFLKDAPEPKLFQAEQTLKVNFYSLVNFTEAILPILNDNGCILNISSSSGHLSRIPSEDIRNRLSKPDLSLEELKTLMHEYLDAVKQNTEVEMWGASPYVVSKVGVNAYTFMLNRRLKNRGIRVNCVHPGYVMSDMTKGAGSISPEDAASLPLQIALNPEDGGLFVWHDGSRVPWDGPDPRGYIDKIL
ncbi:carbonyl reductase [NADPH] 3-like [Zerene cesonia]|uniref:carbonyl reductase [NADPH] 3-like n=1 Tax=Zerene cesonia TaxID=33412 RepID=UPI0018E52141|nr:carbonyl reductase [NADPH] 3-like [Zerene cesonia]XP_038219326.1 carbonyl reductase [NADPH] 3-like [Zerene cesonia]XP_038219327.1 carbonyl reductase [NADPH] 3-like [Zerene cesonia]XP_038219328.1 carbonyl reductase [NADPH] 3-like [Zerene cesonia]